MYIDRYFGVYQSSMASLFDNHLAKETLTYSRVYMALVAPSAQQYHQGALREGVCRSRNYAERRDVEISRRQLNDVIFYVVERHVVYRFYHIVRPIFSKVTFYRGF